MNIKRNIIFTLEKRKKNGVTVVDNVPIRMRVVYNGKRVEFTTGYRVDAAKSRRRVTPTGRRKRRTDETEVCQSKILTKI